VTDDDFNGRGIAQVWLNARIGLDCFLHPLLDDSLRKYGISAFQGKMLQYQEAAVLAERLTV
jgi:hypothetical protein